MPFWRRGSAPQQHPHAWPCYCCINPFPFHGRSANHQQARLQDKVPFITEGWVIISLPEWDAADLLSWLSPQVYVKEKGQERVYKLRQYSCPRRFSSPWQSTSAMLVACLMPLIKAEGHRYFADNSLICSESSSNPHPRNHGWCWKITLFSSALGSCTTPDEDKKLLWIPISK